MAASDFVALCGASTTSQNAGVVTASALADVGRAPRPHRRAWRARRGIPADGRSASAAALEAAGRLLSSKSWRAGGRALSVMARRAPASKLDSRREIDSCRDGVVLPVVRVPISYHVTCRRRIPTRLNVVMCRRCVELREPGVEGRPMIVVGYVPKCPARPMSCCRAAIVGSSSTTRRRLKARVARARASVVTSRGVKYYIVHLIASPRTLTK